MTAFDLGNIIEVSETESGIELPLDAAMCIVRTARLALGNEVACSDLYAITTTLEAAEAFLTTVGERAELMSQKLARGIQREAEV